MELTVYRNVVNAEGSLRVTRLTDPVRMVVLQDTSVHSVLNVNIFMTFSLIFLVGKDKCHFFVSVD